MGKWDERIKKESHMNGHLLAKDLIYRMSGVVSVKSGRTLFVFY